MIPPVFFYIHSGVVGAPHIRPKSRPLPQNLHRIYDKLFRGALRFVVVEIVDVLFGFDC